MDTFTTAYLECALWASSANLSDHDNEACDVTAEDLYYEEKCPNCGQSLESGRDRSFTDLNYGINDIAQESLSSMVEDCKQFQDANAALLARWYAECSETEERAGHDFWLTRNRHGAGYWDRWNSGTPQGNIAQALTDSAHAWGSCDLYLGDDGLIYCQ